MKLETFCATACLLLVSAGSAAADITYVANRTVGEGTLDLSITTDGTLGVLTTANILDWSLVLDDGFTVRTLEGPGGLNNSQARVSDRPSLSATASDLLFDFDVVSDFLNPSAFIIQIVNGGDGGVFEPFWCIAYSSCVGQQTESFSPDGLTVQQSDRAGLFIVGSVNSVVPEPAAWVLAILGFAAAGTALRRQRARQASAKMPA